METLTQLWSLHDAALSGVYVSLLCLVVFVYAAVVIYDRVRQIWR